MKKITECRSCKSQEIQPFLDLGNHPLANSLLNNPNDEEEFYPLSLSYCKNCSLVQLNETIDPKELFSEYVWVTGTSSTARNYSEEFCEKILSKIDGLEDSYVLEVASNDGTFLKPFIKRGYFVLGVDPAKNIVDIALENNVPTKCGFFGEELAKEIVRERGKAKVVFARNVFAHVADLHDFVKGLTTCLADDGLLIIDTHYAKEVFRGLQYDAIYHEHLCYFTLKSTENLLNKHNLHVFDFNQGPIGGGSIETFATKKKRNETKELLSQRVIEESIGLNLLEGWKDFAEKTYAHREELLRILKEVNEKGSVVGYGASARSSTLLNFCGIDKQLVSMIADQSSLKHNKYSAGTHIPIHAPDNVMETNPDYILLMAWNFKEEITKILRDKYNFKGKCIIPLPNKPQIIDFGKIITTNKAIIHRPPSIFPSRKNKIRLNWNELSPGYSQEVIEQIKDLITPTMISSYPEYDKIYPLMAKHLGVNQDQIILENGSDQGIKNVFEVFVTENTNVVIPSPEFAMTYQYSELYRAEIRKIDYDDNLNLSIQELEKTIDKNTSLIYLANPNAPTGKYLEQEDIEKMLIKAKENNAIVFIDECYIDFSGKPSAIKLIDKYDNLIISRSFSKSFGLAGVRLGALVTNPYLCRLLHQTRPMREINTFASEIGTFMLENIHIPNSMRDEIISTREEVSNELRNHGYKVLPSLTNFILVDFGSDKQKFLDKCEKKNILIKDEIDTHKCVEKYIRISIGTKSLMKEVFEKLFPL